MNRRFGFVLKVVLVLASISLMRAEDTVPRFVAGDRLSFPGATDGSAAAPAGKGFFIGATDDKNVLHRYSVEHPSEVEVALPVKLGFSTDNDPEPDEYDIEGAARIGDLAYWIGSHGRKENGKVKEERRVLFATKIGAGAKADITLEPGGPYRGLIDNFMSDEETIKLGLPEAIGTKEKDPTKAPKEHGALNIESLCADGTRLLIGFRNPTIKSGEKSMALIVPLDNPASAVHGSAKGVLGKPILLDLGGLGVRDMVKYDDGVLIIAGSYKDRFDAELTKSEQSQLYYWSGQPGDAPKNLGIDFGDLNPEAIVALEGEKNRLLILSDDGAMRVNGVKMKDLPEDQQSFRAIWIKRQ